MEIRTKEKTHDFVVGRIGHASAIVCSGYCLEDQEGKWVIEIPSEKEATDGIWKELYDDPDFRGCFKGELVEKSASHTTYIDDRDHQYTTDTSYTVDTCINKLYDYFHGAVFHLVVDGWWHNPQEDMVCLLKGEGSLDQLLPEDPKFQNLRWYIDTVDLP